MSFKLPLAIALSLILFLAPLVSAQQNRQTPVKPPAGPVAKPTPAPTPPPTFDTLLSVASYKVYAEVRSVGQLIRSNSVNEILEPIMKLAKPPKEFRTVIKWLNAHAEEVTTSRLLFATWPNPGSAVPESVVAIEFASADEAAKFQQKLNEFLQKMLPPAAESSPQSTGDNSQQASAAKPEQTKPQPPPYHIQQAGSLIVVTPRPVNVNKLRPAGSKLLADDTNFRTARNRFNSESIFIFVNIGEIEKEEREQQKKFEEQHKEAIATMEKNREDLEKAREELDTELEKKGIESREEPAIVGVVPVGAAADSTKDKPPPAAVDFLFEMGLMMSAFSGVDAKWPEAIGVAISLEGESFDVRALLVNKPGEKSDSLPFLPLLSTGPPIVPEAPNILPADTEMLLAFSLDLPHIYNILAKPHQRPIVVSGETRPETSEYQPGFASIEKQLNIKIKDDLLPLLGSEVAVSFPLTGMNMLQPPTTEPSASPSPSPSASPSPEGPAGNGGGAKETKSERSPVLVISLKDKEGMRRLLPKIIEAVAFKGANGFAQTERREDTELISYLNLVAYAFIGNYLVISPDAAATRHVVDSYLKHQTLAGDPHFKNYARWQPRQLQGQLYISPGLMEGYQKWAQHPTTQLDDETRAFLTRFSIVAQPVTYSLSNEGFGPFHELHLPKNLVLLFIAAIAGGTKHSAPDVTNQTPANPSNPF